MTVRTGISRCAPDNRKVDFPMPNQILVEDYQIEGWPHGDPAIIYLRIGGEIVAAAAGETSRGWRVIVYRDDGALTIDVGSRENAVDWLHTLGDCGPALKVLVA